MVLEAIETSDLGEETILVEEPHHHDADDVMKVVSSVGSTAGGSIISPSSSAAHHKIEDSENMEPTTSNTVFVEEQEREQPVDNDSYDDNHDGDDNAGKEKEEEAPEDEVAVVAKQEPAAPDEEGVEIEAPSMDIITPKAGADGENDEEVENLEERDFDKNPTVLFALLQKKEWQAAMDRSRETRDEAAIWVSRKEKDGRLRWRLLPVHAAIVFRAPEEVIDCLLKTFPKGAQAKDDQGMLPLHLAFRNGSSEAVVNLLLVAYPPSIDVKDRKGRTPLVLAQASTSPNKDAFLRLLERGPTYYAVAAAAQERAAATAEQRAIFDAQVMQLKQSHQHELETLQLEAEHKQRILEFKVEEMEKEIMRTQETSQVLVDHVNSLEAQLNSRSDTERFLATKIATLDSSLKSAEKGREEVEEKLKLENVTLIAERDGYKSKLKEVEQAHLTTQEQLKENIELLEKREEEYMKVEKDLQVQFKSTQIDWANAQANCAILDAQLRKKMETEHALATQVSSLAGKLAESASEYRESSKKYSKKIKDLEEERVMLRESVQDLTKRLKLVARVLDDMNTAQAKIMQQAAVHEQTLTNALDSHSKIVADAKEQQMQLEQARLERDQMRKRLEEQEAKAGETEIKRASIMTAIVVQGEHMQQTALAREEMLNSVTNMREDVKGVLASILSVLPDESKLAKGGDAMIDAVVQCITSPASKEELALTVSMAAAAKEKPSIEEEKKEDDVYVPNTTTVSSMEAQGPDDESIITHS